MSDPDYRARLALTALAAVGAGALLGAALGLLAGRNPRAEGAEGAVAETVEDLKRRAEQILSELSQGGAPPAAL
jgi:hypothetical protein